MEQLIVGLGTLLGAWFVYAGWSRGLWERSTWPRHLFRVALAGSFGLWAHLAHAPWPLLPASLLGFAAIIWLFKHVTSYFVKTPSWAKERHHFYP